MASPLREYDAKLDSKKRITLRGARTEYFHVTEKEDGTIELSPRELVHPDTISERTYNMVNQAIQKYKQGAVSEPVDQEELDRLLNLSANRRDASSE